MDPRQRIAERVRHLSAEVGVAEPNLRWVSKSSKSEVGPVTLQLALEDRVEDLAFWLDEPEALDWLAVDTRLKAALLLLRSSRGRDH